jgi:hypothetical protein
MEALKPVLVHLPERDKGMARDKAGRKESGPRAPVMGKSEESCYYRQM